MSRRGRWRFGLFLGLLGFALATAGKWLFNGLDAGFYDVYNSPGARTADEAAARGLLVARFRIDPARVEGEGKAYELEEAWLEAADEPGHLLIWLPDRKRAGWCYLCVRPRTEWFHGDFSFNPFPEYREPFTIAGPGQNGVGWTQSGNDLYFQKVPADLRELDLRVDVGTYGKGKGYAIGKVHLTRVN